MKFLHVQMIYNTVLYDDFSTLHYKFVYLCSDDFFHIPLPSWHTYGSMYMYVQSPPPTCANSTHFLERSSSLCDGHTRLEYSYSASCHCNFLASSLYWLFYIISTTIFFAFLFLCPRIVTSCVKCFLWLVYVLWCDITHVTSECTTTLFQYIT